MVAPLYAAAGEGYAEMAAFLREKASEMWKVVAADCPESLCPAISRQVLGACASLSAQQQWSVEERSIKIIAAN